MDQPIIKFCSHNLRFGLEKTFRLIQENHPDWMIDLNTCWGKCDTCANDPYALVGNTRLTAFTPEELYLELERHLATDTPAEKTG